MTDKNGEAGFSASPLHFSFGTQCITTRGNQKIFEENYAMSQIPNAKLQED